MGRMPPGPREGNEAPTSAWGAGTRGHYGGVRREPQHCLEPVPCRELPGCGRLARATFMGLGLRCHLGLGRKQLPGRPRRRPPCPPPAFLWAATLQRARRSGLLPLAPGTGTPQRRAAPVPSGCLVVSSAHRIWEGVEKNARHPEAQTKQSLR